jgi:hypothetical protein
MGLEFRQRCPLGNHAIDPWTARQERRELRLAFDHNGGATAFQERCVADELKGVTQALLGIKEDRPPAQRLAPSAGLCKPGAVDSRAPPAPLVLGPSLFELPGLKP